MHNIDSGRNPKRQSFPPSSSAGQFALDEGFAESSGDSQHQENNDSGSFAETAANFQLWLGSQSEDQRGAIALEILKTLRTSQISAIVERLTPLLHMNPVELLPPEVTFEIFSRLDASTLLTACLASHTWRERILDPRLWQQLYKTEGWGVDYSEVKKFEENQAALMRSEFKKARGQMRASYGKGQPLMKRRATSDWLESIPRKISADVSQWREQHGVVEADTDAIDNTDQEMQDVPGATQLSPPRPNKRHSQDSGDEMDYTREPANETFAPSEMKLLVEDAQGDIKLNWPHLYKQRYKLEMNWQRGRYTNFQLPHPNYPQEAHTECVYTIQFHGKWLVSGSRDKTLRIWDMETRRLRGKPLVGHSQSVLCLQFDPSEEEDVIISGSSDSSVIVWRFSTGQRTHVIPSAHEESVLNLRFDKRYLVTCSKDKKIKIWNRHTLTPLDKDYPKVGESSSTRFPSYIVDISTMDPSFLDAKLANGQIKTLKPYTHLMTLEGHAAAVNAIQINGDLIVSASGDRLIRVWNVKTGQGVRAVPGHQKGIACVQFDSRRIVSGSSDNSVRIYDLVTGAEVAVLLGHSNLVRTVQAGFGDIPGSEEEDEVKARQAEMDYLRGLETGAIVEDRNFLRRQRQGEAGTSRVPIGSKLPPGGGGSKWGRIVSGSYDESIIIWKKDAHGDWVVGQTLRQEAAVRACVEADRMRLAEQGMLPNEHGRRWRQTPNLNGNATPGLPISNPSVNAQVMSASQIMQQAMNASMAGLHNGIQNVMGLSRGLNWNGPPRSVHGGAVPNSADVASLIGPAVQTAMNQVTTQAHAVAQSAIAQAATNGGRATISISPSQQVTHSITVTNGQAPISSIANSSTMGQAGSSTQGSNPQPASQASTAHQDTTMMNAPPPAPTQQQQIQTPAVPAGHHQHMNQQQQPASRVFKLQFDARRIVCCSQDSRIIGWDFANGDLDVEAACRFFIGP